MAGLDLGVVAGVRVRVHPLFALILAVAALGGEGRAALLLAGLLLTHELAHLLVARAYGLEVPEVEFLPFGGVARLEGLSEAEPGVEAAVALAGPLNNLLLLAAGVGLERSGLIAGELARLFVEGNLALALFNLLPALPLDGGRFCRSLLGRRLGYVRASRLLARLGRGIALLLLAGGAAALARGLFVPNAFALGGFLLLAASREEAAAGWEGLQAAWRKGALLRRRRVLAVVELVALADTPVRELARHLTPQRYHRIRVVDDRLTALGVVEEGELIRALTAKGAGLTLGELVRRG